MSLKSAKSIPRSSPSALVRRNQRLVVRSEPRRRHACGDGGQGKAALPAVAAEVVKQVRKAQHVQRRKRGMLDAERACVAVGGRGDVGSLPVAGRGLCALTLQQPRRDPACFGLDLWRVRHEIEQSVLAHASLGAVTNGYRKRLVENS